jgi:hypothetical protein
MGLYNPATVTVPSTSSSVGTVTNVPSVITSTTILAANANRRDAKIYNSSTARLYLAFSATATVTAFTILLEAGGTYEMTIIYTGLISGIWAAANGSALVTELT